LTYNTLKNYVSALNELLEGTNIGNHPLILKLYKRFRKFKNPPKFEAIWSLPDILNKYQSVNSKSSTHKALFLLKVATLARGKSEIHALKRSDIQFEEAQATVTFTGGKTHNNSERWSKVIFKLPEEKAYCCPYRALKSYMDDSEHIPNTTPDSPLWRSKHTKTALASDTLRNYIKTEMTILGINTELYTPHSIRAAVATHLFDQGATARQVMHLGNWKSEDVMEQFYVRSEKKSADPKLIFSA
jgi:integrase